MQIRDWMGSNQPIVAGIAILVLIFSFAYMTCTLSGGGSGGYRVITEHFFYDLNTGEVYVASSDLVPPVSSPSDEARGTKRYNGVRAYVFSCTDCSDYSSHEVRYLQRFTPKSKKMQEQMRDGKMSDEMIMMVSPEEESEIKRPDDEEWYPAMSEEAQEIFEETYRECDNGELPRECFPLD